MESKYFRLNAEEREKWNTLETIGQQTVFLADLKRMGKAEHPFFCVGNIRFPIDIDEHMPEN